MKKIKTSIAYTIIILLPFLLGTVKGECNIFELLFYIPCEQVPTENFKASAVYHDYSTGGTVYVSESGGIYLSYDLCANPQIDTLVGIPLNDVTSGFWEAFNVIVGNNGRIYRSSPSLPSWTSINSPTSQNLNRMCLIPLTNIPPADYIFAIGDGGTVISSNNNGLTWWSKNIPENVNLNDLECELLDTNNIRVVGDNLTAYYSTDGGNTWIDDSVYIPSDNYHPGIDLSNGGNDLLTVQFVNQNTGYIAGEFGIFFKTTNGGGNYSISFTPSFNNITDMYFISPDSGFIVTNTGEIFFTSNRGGSWSEDTAVTNLIGGRSINKINTIGDDWGYITGDSGLLILAARDSITIGIEPIPQLSPKVYYLFQNYPNPFNPVTTIRYNIIKSAHVILKVYDITGREAAILVNERKKSGDHRVSFSGAELPSGIYFYKLIVNGFSEVRKMVLVK